MVSLKIDGIEVPLDTAHDVQQSYMDVEGGTKRVRTLNGRLSSTSLWKKCKTTISGNGWRPSDSDVRQGRQLILSCVKPRAIDSLSRVINVPSARRSDVPLYAYAMVGGEYQSAGFLVTGNVVTIDLVPLASSYRVMYLPELLVSITEASEALDVAGAVYSWQLTAEEV